MRLEVLNTGSELLLGHVVNTHLGFLAHSIFPLGLIIHRQVTVPDGPAIRDALQETFTRADIVIVTGGLGPTTDDLTRELTAELLGLPLEHDPAIESAIAARFKRRDIPMTDRVMRQAQKPVGSRILPNAFGTAPGLYIPPQPLPGTEAGNSPHLFLLPGPPKELHPMVEHTLVPLLRELLPASQRALMETWRIVGVPESTVEDRVGEALIALGIDPGYCARLGEVDVRVVGTAEQIEAAAGILQKEFGDSMLPSGARPLEEWLVEELTNRHLTLASAESCTGGALANRITNVPGASAVFLEGRITYANEAKVELGVPAQLIEQHGAVSEPVAGQMAICARNRANSTYALSTTGIAGPGGATEEKPLGTVFVALAGPNGLLRVEKHRFHTDRLSFKHLTSQTALDLLRKELMGQLR
ncbi:MAG: CinA family nicotinamide mononucleotide deamidase-related protein [Verrucomicrobiota bacterium]